MSLSFFKFIINCSILISLHTCICIFISIFLYLLYRLNKNRRQNVSVQKFKNSHKKKHRKKLNYLCKNSMEIYMSQRKVQVKPNE